MSDNRIVVRSESMNPSDILPSVEKGWGSYTVLHEEPESLTVLVTLTAGNRMRYHQHEQRKELWIVVAGSGVAVLDETEVYVNPGSIVNLPSGVRHTVIAFNELKIVEVQIGNTDIADKKIFNLCQDYYEDGSREFRVMGELASV